LISPPSNQTQYWDICVQFGDGFEYQVWKIFDDEEFFIIRSRSVHLRLLHSSCNPRDPESHLGGFQATETQHRLGTSLDECGLGRPVPFGQRPDEYGE
jgi:hypothetical protein